jgi:hypothetical protein
MRTIFTWLSQSIVTGSLRPLCTLCGEDVALIICSPGENVFSFNFFNVDTVIDCYLSRFPPQNNGTMQLCELNSQLTQINNVLDIEKRCSDKLSHMLKMTEADCRWAWPVDAMNKSQLDLFKRALEVHKKLFLNIQWACSLGCSYPNLTISCWKLFIF